MINKQSVRLAVRLLGKEHTRCILRLAEKQDQIENEWSLETKKLHDQIVKQIVIQFKRDGSALIPNKVFEEFLLTHYIAVAAEAVESVAAEMRVIAPVQMASKPLPRSFSEIRKLYDRYKKTGKLPKPLKVQAAKIKDLYLKKTQSVWKKYASAFREGDEFTQEFVLRKIENAAETVKSRAKTIVRTETTNYYNQTRREIYDQSDAIWGYLFLAIRDQGTTKWCSDKVRDGKRGRHGLVYQKGDPLTDKETPSCHWNCRSEFTPLTMFNPRHRILIENLRLRRSAHKCHPLPEGWR